jgi:hypothetical protein
MIIDESSFVLCAFFLDACVLVDDGVGGVGVRAVARCGGFVCVWAVNYQYIRSRYYPVR